MGLFDYIIDNKIETLPNLKMKTMGGRRYWDTIKELPGDFRVQKHKIDSNHYRILDSNDIRVSYGSKKVIENYINNHFNSMARKIKRGDVIAVDRMGKTKLYQHFGVYVGNEQVIHFNGDEKSSNLVDKIPFIHRSSMDEFMSNSKDVYVLDFDEFNNESWQFKGVLPKGNSFDISSITDASIFIDIERLGIAVSPIFTKTLVFGIYEIINSQEYHIFSPEETVARAESKLGCKKYNLFFNNCEHFAIWCKTGLHISEQINKLLNAKIWKGVTL